MKQLIGIQDWIKERDAYLKRLKLARKAGKQLQIKDLCWFV